MYYLLKNEPLKIYLNIFSIIHSLSVSNANINLHRINHHRIDKLPVLHYEYIYIARHNLNIIIMIYWSSFIYMCFMNIIAVRFAVIIKFGENLI